MSKWPIPVSNRIFLTHIGEGKFYWFQIKNPKKCKIPIWTCFVSYLIFLESLTWFILFYLYPLLFCVNLYVFFRIDLIWDTTTYSTLALPPLKRLTWSSLSAQTQDSKLLCSTHVLERATSTTIWELLWLVRRLTSPTSMTTLVIQPQP